MKLTSALVVLNLASSVYLGCGGGDDSSPAQIQEDAGGSDATADVTATDSSPPTDSGVTDSGGDSGTPFMAQTFSITMDKVAGSAGSESTKCITKKLGNVGTVHAGSLHTIINGGTSVGLIVYKVDDTVEGTTPTNCQPFHAMALSDGGTALTVAQAADELLQFPVGDGFTLADHQMVRIELHAVDADGTGVGATASFTTIADADFKRDVGMIFGGTPDISIPSNGTTQVHEVLPVPSVMSSSDLLFLSGHQHQYGTGVMVNYGPAGAGPTIYDDTAALFSAPTLTALPAHETLSTTDGFGLTCSWHNTSNAPVAFGSSANDEQCFFRAHYAPSNGTRICIHTNQGSGADICCPGGGAACNTLF
ncbi:MAG: hypothetical protein ABI551_24105 [Polyangiaceae bacterium]